MSDHEIVTKRVSTQLCEATHKTRGKLLVASSTGIVISITGLVPKKIEGFNISFSPEQQNAMIYCLLALITFLLISFLISAISDIVSNKVQRKGDVENSLLSIMNEARDKLMEGEQQANDWYFSKHLITDISKDLDVTPWTINFLSCIRFFWDVILPVVVAICSVIFLILYVNYDGIFASSQN